ncbi:hypothetical protein L228DRAFT_283929 [Xylona heveae TC161]|uniref:BTB domain transcription factor n=1 Tax=Xylona heveae (strain CBS 132557 / TC161) TaxID=1328760 RepID=A0A165G6N4_XYLHT|nr:hypothetical protein L228DRAFT_283929 [Xylona heveae TC161]KZF21800.1 hypothetical protein L228DRAFT_283929 [Xylona heveae TC161]
MVGTRSSARLAAAANSKPETQGKDVGEAAAGDKRKAEAGVASKSKRGRKKSGEAEQKSIEETMPLISTESQPQSKDRTEKETDMKDKEETKVESPEAGVEKTDKAEDTAKEAVTAENDAKANGTAEARESKPENGAIEESAMREEEVPSNVLEKGIIYFFFRGRVGIDDPKNVNDIARSYIVLRPLPQGAKLTEGPLEDLENNRLLALPKKVLPTSHRDRFLTFVEKANTTLKDLRENFIASSDYETKTAGTRHTPAATPAAEGVYAITTTGRESHLAYILTIPSDVEKVQKDLGLRQKGSFIASVRNPQYPSPPNAQLPQAPEFPKEVLEEFRSLRWAGLQPKFLNYANSQILFIGESQGEIGKAGEKEPNEEDKDKEAPIEEMEKLENEDEIRTKHLKGDESVFVDLGISAKEYSGVPSSWA